MKVWAVANQKGGVGKTTSAVTLAGHLIKRNKRVLLVDLDPHGSMTAYFGHDPDSIDPSVYELFQSDGFDPDLQRRVMLSTKYEGLQLLPASTALATLDRQLGTKEGKGLVIKRALDSVADDFDYVLIDCPPLLGILMVNALAACTHLLVPVQTEFLALKGLERMMRTLEMIIKARKGELDYTIVPTLFDRRTRASVQSLRMLREQYGSHLWDSVIPVDTMFREASQQGEPLPLMQAETRGALAYAALLSLLLGEQQHPQLTVVK